MGPLTGFKVVDASEGIAGPFCAKLLADYGADVIKVEPPGGDFMRRAGPMGRPTIEASGTYLYLNTSKRGITLDLAQPTAKDAYRRLARWADVVIESSAPGFLASRGLAAADLLALHRRLVVVSVTSFGQQGPYTDYRANEMVFCALGGLFIITGERDRAPISIALPRVQFLAGLHAYDAALGALFGVAGGGDGVHVDVPIVNSVVACLQNATTVFSYSGYQWERVGNFRPGAYPISVFACADGHVSLAAHDEIRWKALCTLLGRPELLDDPRFRKSPLRAANRQALDEYLVPWFRDKRKFELFELGQKSGVGMGIVATPQDILTLPQHDARDFFVTVDQPGIGTVRYPGVPFKLPGLAGTPRPAPALGQHNAEVYRDVLGYGEEDVNALFHNRVI